jgi:hypothetical protein
VTPVLAHLLQIAAGIAGCDAGVGSGHAVLYRIARWCVIYPLVDATRLRVP